MIDAFCASNGPIPAERFVRSRGVARFQNACIGGFRARKARSSNVDAGKLVVLIRIVARPPPLLEVTGLEELEVFGRASDEPKKTTPLLVFRSHNPGLSNRRAWKRHRVGVQWSGAGSGAFLSSGQGWS